MELSDLRVIVTKLNSTDKKTLSDGIKRINSSYDPDSSVLEAYDIKLVDSNGDTVTLTDGKVKVCLAFPASLTKKYTNYIFSVYHQKSANGFQRMNPITVNAQGVWFESDSFSPYGLVSVQKSGGNEPSPGTGETILMTVVAIIMLTLAACAIAIVVIRNRKSDGEDR